MINDMRGARAHTQPFFTRHPLGRPYALGLGPGACHNEATDSIFADENDMRGVRIHTQPFFARHAPVGQNGPGPAPGACHSQDSVHCPLSPIL